MLNQITLDIGCFGSVLRIIIINFVQSSSIGSKTLSAIGGNTNMTSPSNEDGKDLTSHNRMLPNLCLQDILDRLLHFVAFNASTILEPLANDKRMQAKSLRHCNSCIGVHMEGDSY